MSKPRKALPKAVEQGGPYCQDSFFKNLRAQHTFGWFVISKVVRVIERSLLPIL
jgi:hypothetical protein